GGVVGVVALPVLDEIGVRFALRVGMPRTGLAGLRLVVAGAEGAAGAREDDHPDGAIGIRLIKRTVKLGFQVSCECIHSLRAIEGDRRDPLLDRVDHFPVSHPSPFRYSAALVTMFGDFCPTGSSTISTAMAPVGPTMMGLRSSARKRPLFAAANCPRPTSSVASASMLARSRPRAPSSIGRAL